MRAGTPKRVIQGAAQYAVVVQDGSDINHVKLGTDRAQRQDGLFKPHFQLVALVGVAHHLVVFDIVKDGKVGAECTMHHAAHFLARAEDLDFDVGRGNNRPRLPNRHVAKYDTDRVDPFVMPFS